MDTTAFNALASQVSEVSTVHVPNNYGLGDDGLVHFVKPMENGKSAEVMMSPGVVEELGGYANVERVFKNSVDTGQQIILITSKELEQMVADQGLSALDGMKKQSDILDKQFGQYVEYTYGGALAFWDEKTLALNNHVFPSEKNPAIIVMDSSFFEDKPGNIDGSRQQKIDFWLGHEFDHVDNYKNEPNHEFMSDINAIRGIQGNEISGNTSKDQVVDSVVRMRIRDEISRVMKTGIYGNGFFGLDDYSFGPYIKDALNSDAVATFPQNAREDVQKFQYAVDAVAREILPEKIRAAYTYPTSPVEALLSSDSTAAEYANGELRRAIRFMDIPEEQKREFRRQLSDIPNTGEKAQADVFRSLYEKYPEEVEAGVRSRFSTRMFDKVYSGQFGDTLPEHLRTQMEYINNIEDNSECDTAKVGFIKDLISENNAFYQNYMDEYYQDFAVSAIRQHQPEVWEQMIDDVAVRVQQTQKDSIDPKIMEALSISVDNAADENNQIGGSAYKVK